MTQDVIDPTATPLSDAEREAVRNAAWNAVGCDGYGGHQFIRLGDLHTEVARIKSAARIDERERIITSAQVERDEALAEVAAAREERDAASERADFLSEQGRRNAQAWPARVAAARADERARITAAVEGLCNAATTSANEFGSQTFVLDLDQFRAALTGADRG